MGRTLRTHAETARIIRGGGLNRNASRVYMAWKTLKRMKELAGARPSLTQLFPQINSSQCDACPLLRFSKGASLPHARGLGEPLRND